MNNMTTLILNIDRDNDFGRKADVKSPIIGVKNNIDAANKLGFADPEDSDLNAVFLAIATYNSLKKEGGDVEIATICGDISVGVKSDQILSKQLEQVINETKAKDVIVISDGAEDEYILPLIQSRIPITSIKRVSVKQSKQLEDTYYRVIKLLNDDKVKKQLIFPISMLLIVGAVFVVLHMVAMGIGAILFTLGAYLLIRVFNLEKKITLFLSELKSGFLFGKISFYTSFIALVVLVINLFYAWSITQNELSVDRWLISIFLFLKNIIWGIVSSGLIFIFGRLIDLYVREKTIHWSYWNIPFSLFGFGFITSAVSEALYISFNNKLSIKPFLTISFVSYISIGVLIVFIGTGTYYYIKDKHVKQDNETMLKKESTHIADK
ncbi:MAG: DUF373 family protein [Candidatus Thermoplasmatota archaeon]